jgi:hypothetical protein
VYVCIYIGMYGVKWMTPMYISVVFSAGIYIYIHIYLCANMRLRSTNVSQGFISETESYLAFGLQ